MGLSKAALRFLVREHRRKPLHGSVLTLGRQCVYATYPQLVSICRQEGVAPLELPAGEVTTTNIPSWLGTNLEKNTSDAAVFRVLGADQVLALDYSDFEGAELAADLNQPLPPDLHHRFDVVVDSGTLEHIFDTRAVLMNVGNMLRPQGRVIHLSPCNNYANHGFYQISPTLLIDYYRANGYRDIRAWVAAETDRQYATSSWDLYELDTQNQPVLMTSRGRLTTLVVAEKQESSTVDQIPMQSYYQNLFASVAKSETPDSKNLTWSMRLKQRLPIGLRHFIRSHFLPSEHAKPWGLKRTGRLK
jgi:hypothetical protein